MRATSHAVETRAFIIGSSWDTDFYSSHGWRVIGINGLSYSFTSRIALWHSSNSSLGESGPIDSVLYQLHFDLQLRLYITFSSSHFYFLRWVAGSIHRDRTVTDVTNWVAQNGDRTKMIVVVGKTTQGFGKSSGRGTC